MQQRARLGRTCIMRSADQIRQPRRRPSAIEQAVDRSLSQVHLRILRAGLFRIPRGGLIAMAVGSGGKMIMGVDDAADRMPVVLVTYLDAEQAETNHRGQQRPDKQQRCSSIGRGTHHEPIIAR